MQLPAVTVVTLKPLTVQTAGVADVNVTGSADEAVAVKGIVAALKLCAPGFANVMVCELPLMVTDNVPVVNDPEAFVALTVKLDVPIVLGVPDKTPVVGFNVKLLGRVPENTEYVGAGEPFATNV